METMDRDTYMLELIKLLKSFGQSFKSFMHRNEVDPKTSFRYGFNVKEDWSVATINVSFDAWASSAGKNYSAKEMNLIGISNKELFEKYFIAGLNANKEAIFNSMLDELRKNTQQMMRQHNMTIDWLFMDDLEKLTNESESESKEEETAND